MISRRNFMWLTSAAALCSWASVTWPPSPSSGSSAKAVRRSSSLAKRCRHIVRVSVVMGEAKEPASAAHAAITGKGIPSFVVTRIPVSASGCITPVT